MMINNYKYKRNKVKIKTLRDFSPKRFIKNQKCNNYLATTTGNCALCPSKLAMIKYLPLAYLFASKLIV